jgi:hypothetical protein
MSRQWVLDVDELLSLKHLSNDNIEPRNLRFPEQFLAIITKAKEAGEPVCICTSQPIEKRYLVLDFLGVLCAQENLERADYIPDANMRFGAPYGNKSEMLVDLHLQNLGLVAPLHYTVLIDDHLGNCRTAHKAGFSAIHLPPCIKDLAELTKRENAFRDNPQVFYESLGEKLGKEFAGLAFGGKFTLKMPSSGTGFWGAPARGGLSACAAQGRGAAAAAAAMSAEQPPSPPVKSS